MLFRRKHGLGNVATEITYQVQSQAFDYLDAPIEKINTADTPAPYSPVLLKEWLPNSEDVIKAVKKGIVQIIREFSVINSISLFLPTN